MHVIAAGIERTTSARHVVGWFERDDDPEDQVWDDPGDTTWKQQQNPEKTHQPDRNTETLGKTGRDTRDDAMPARSNETT